MKRPVTACLAMLLAALPAAAAAAAAAPDAYGPAINTRIFDRAASLVEQKYWDHDAVGERLEPARERARARIAAAIDRRQVYTILGEWLDRLGDSHVYAIDPVQIAIGRAHDKGQETTGFGFAMLPDDAGTWRVRSVRAGGEASLEGVAIGWEVAGVDGQPVDIDYQPEPGRRVPIRFVDEHRRDHLVTLTAETQAALPLRRARRLPGGVLLLALDGFAGGDDRWLAERLRDGPPPAAVILDLRDNGGGDADVIARVAGLFYPENRVLVRRVAARETVQRTQGAGPGSWLGPLAVLIGPESASGAEAIAALVDESRRGITVGERTAGALTGASDYRLPDGGMLSVAEFDIRTPGGRRLEGRGLGPRIPVTATLADRRAGRDPVLERASALLRQQAAAR